MRLLLAIQLVSAFLTLQTQQFDIGLIGRDLRTAIEREEFGLASDLAKQYDAAVQAQYRAWLVRDLNINVEEALSWLPGDTESVWVNQEPFTINSNRSLEQLYDQPAQVYSLDRLSELNQGNFYRALTNRTIRMVVAGARDTRSANAGIPGAIPRHDVVYLYFLAEPANLSMPDEFMENWPVWRGVSMVDSGEPFKPGFQQTKREDENWIALGRPEVLVLTNNKSLLREILRRIANGSTTRALPADLPEWKQVDQTASFWGLRHYAAQSKPKQGERGFNAANLPRPDGLAVGATVQLNPAERRLEVRYLSALELDKGAAERLSIEFGMDQGPGGVWRL